MKYTNKEVKKILTDFVRNLKKSECMYDRGWTNTHVEYYYGKGGPIIQKRRGAQIGNLYPGSVLLEAPRLSTRELSEEVDIMMDEAFRFWIKKNDFDKEREALREKYQESDKYETDWEVAYEELSDIKFFNWKEEALQAIEDYFEGEDLEEDFEYIDDFRLYFQNITK